MNWRNQMTNETVAIIMILGMIGLVLALIKNTDLSKKTHKPLH